jgi:adrenodoxin-NADP+ reductase
MSPLFRFFGNVNIIGSTPSSGTGSAPSQASSSYSYPLATKIPFSSLLPHYTHIILAYGSSLSRPLGIPGSEAGALFNVHPALDFVNWYNGHPAAHDAEYLAAHPWKKVSLEGLHHATIVGAGNVALDVARILLRSSSTLNNVFQKDQGIKARASLHETDIPEAVLSQLSKSSVKHVDVVARRGPAQVAFTNKELREMMDLQGVHYQGVKTEDLELAQSQVAALEAASNGNDGAGLGEVRVRKRLLSILEKGSKADKDSSVAWSTSFLQSPKQFKGKGRAVSEVEWDEMTFKGQPAQEEQQGQPWSASYLAGSSGNQLVKTGNVKTTPTDLVITSVGYKGAPLDGSDPIQTNTGLIPWDSKRGIVPNRTGRVLGKNANAVSRRGSYRESCH